MHATMQASQERYMLGFSERNGMLGNENEAILSINDSAHHIFVERMHMSASSDSGSFRVNA